MYHTFRICQAALAAALLMLAASPPARAQTQPNAAAPSQAALEEGMAIYQTANGCELCHQWGGLGFQHNMLFGPVPAGGPSLVKSTMTRDEMIERVACGKLTPISVMPKYLGDAWTREHPCYGGKLARDLPAEEMPVFGERLLSMRQIELVVDYVRTVYQGHGMSRDWCERYSPRTPQVCAVVYGDAPGAPAATAPTEERPGTVFRPATPAQPFTLPAVPK